MPQIRKNIQINSIKKLYFDKGLSMKQAAAKLGISEPTFRKRFREHDLVVRRRGSWAIRYPKKPFNGNEQEKAYIMGFRIGDMNVYKPKGASNIIVARTNTTQKDQITVMYLLFKKYGGVNVCGKNKAQNVNCYLDTSFSFMLVDKPYKVEKWVKDKQKNCLAFMAGYIDAEGNFIINQGRARFKIDSYDNNILFWMHKWLLSNGIKSKLKILGKRGEPRYGGSYWNKDIWRLNINEAISLDKFSKQIKPYMLHKKRIKDIEACGKNITERKKNGTI